MCACVYLTALQCGSGTKLHFPFLAKGLTHAEGLTHEAMLWGEVVEQLASFQLLEIPSKQAIITL